MKGIRSKQFGGGIALFIVFEGPDGSGKTMLAQAFTAHLRDKGIDALYTFEPTSDGAYGQQVRELLKTSRACDPIALSDLLTADRGDHLTKTILPALSKGQWVVCDRYKYSALAYQQAQGVDAAYLIESNSKYQSPDMVFILQPKSVDTLLDRMERRGTQTDLFEKRAFLIQTLEFYNKMPSYFPNDVIHFLDAECAVFELIQRISAYIWNC